MPDLELVPDPEFGYDGNLCCRDGAWRVVTWYGQIRAEYVTACLLHVDLARQAFRDKHRLGVTSVTMTEDHYTRLEAERRSRRLMG